VKASLLAIASLVVAGCASAPGVLPHDPAPKVASDPNTCADLRAFGPIQAIYPHEALETGQEGWARVRFDVSADGDPTNIRHMGSNPPGFFDASAEATLRRIRFGNFGDKDCELVLEYKK
jgi:TonB family protein